MARITVNGLCGAYDSGNIYIHLFCYNAILKYNLKSNKGELIRGRDRYGLCKKALSTQSIMYQGNIYFLPRVSDSVLKFDMATQRKKEIVVGGNTNYYDPVINGGKLLLFPQFWRPEIPCIDLQTDEVSYVPLNIKAEELRFDIQGGTVFSSAIRIGQYIYRLCRQEAALVRYDCRDYSVHLIRMEDKYIKLRSMAYTGQELWILLSDSARIIQYDLMENRVVKEIVLDNYVEQDTFSGEIYYLNGQMWISSTESLKLAAIDLINEKINVYNPSSGTDLLLLKPYLFGQAFEDEEGNLFFCSASIGGIISISSSGEMKVISWEIDENEIKKLGDVQEVNERMFSLDWFVNFLQKADMAEARKEENGEKIWKRFCYE